MQQTHTLALVSLIFGILGVVNVCPGLGPIIALATGYMAKGEIEREPARYTGDGMAKAGIILGWIGLALIVCAICAAVAYFTGMLALFGLSYSSSSQSLVPVLLKLAF